MVRIVTTNSETMNLVLYLVYIQTAGDTCQYVHVEGHFKSVILITCD